jgi:hypothetical protein
VQEREYLQGPLGRLLERRPVPAVVEKHEVPIGNVVEDRDADLEGHHPVVVPVDVRTAHHEHDAVPPCHLEPVFYLLEPEWHSGRISSVAEPQLSVRSAKARDLARRLARREHRSIADVVERALEAYEIREAEREPASAFYARLANDYGSDLDLEAVIRENRKINPGPEL